MTGARSPSTAIFDCALVRLIRWLNDVAYLPSVHPKHALWFHIWKQHNQQRLGRHELIAAVMILADAIIADGRACEQDREALDLLRASLREQVGPHEKRGSVFDIIARRDLEQGRN
jgi:hypothetical protein